ncbi:hypothetical protein DXG03_007355 [Asterophora parasitica]|uniref:F-box domain-containing protein n=1 Tax=Asterophora parasitica TaxID=117018 RepID=A0A9P7KAU9_9AGAR|nr:hypothetical protein DXG03_007355 [Asterophora parasitica]
MDYGRPDMLDSITEDRYPVESPPYLLILGEDEAVAQSEENKLRSRVSRGKADASELDTRDFVLCYRNLRVFDFIEGFHDGYLDLTGRHPHRYIDLVDRFSAYAPDLGQVKKLVTQVTTDGKDWRGNIVTFIDYKFSDGGAAWDTFRKKIATVLETNPPKFQELCLDHLPPEILDHIYEFARLGDARILSSTCRRLNEIGRRHIFRRRTLVFEHPDGLLGNKSDDVDVADYLPLALASSERLNSTVDFLLEHPELLDKLQTLTIRDQWLSGLASPRPFTFSSVGFGVYVRVYQAFTQSLYVLELVDCCLPEDIEEALESGEYPLQWNSVYNLQIKMAQDVPTLWPTLLLCPNLRTLSVIDFIGGVMQLPHPHAAPALYFQHLTHLTICGAADADLPHFILWLSSATSLAQLTHFKFTSPRGLFYGSVVLLLHILAELRALLQVLVLEGLTTGDYTIFDHIGGMFPNLIGLTLVYRASDRQTVNRPAAWPHPAWMYAPHLAGLTHLQYFAWNNDEGGLTVSSAALRRFEEGFYDEAHETDYEKWADTKDDDFFEEDLRARARARMAGKSFKHRCIP